MSEGAAERAAFPALSLRVNFAWTLAGTVVYAACQWGVLVVLAKLCSPEEVGNFALAIAVTSPIFLLSNLQLRSIQATDARREVRFSDYLGVRAAGTTVSCAISLGIALLGNFPPSARAVIVTVALAKAVESFCDVLYGLFQQHERMDCIAISLFARGLLGLWLVGAGVWLGRTATWAAAGMVVAWSAVLFFHDLPARTIAPEAPLDRRPRPQRWRDRSRVAMTGVPLGVVMLLVSLNQNIPRYFLQATRGERQLGLFAAIASILTAGLVIVNALGQSASPRLAALAAHADRAGFKALLSKLLLGVASVGVIGLIAAQLMGPTILRLLFTPEYAAHAPVLVTIMIAGAIGFLASILGYAMTALRIFKAQVPLFAITCLVAASWAWFDAPRAGIAGAARAMVAAAIVQAIVSAVIVLRRIPAEKRP